jgi:hypothetical protein
VCASSASIYNSRFFICVKSARRKHRGLAVSDAYVFEWQRIEQIGLLEQVGRLGLQSRKNLA